MADAADVLLGGALELDGVGVAEDEDDVEVGGLNEKGGRVEEPVDEEKADEEEEEAEVDEEEVDEGVDEVVSAGTSHAE